MPKVISYTPPWLCRPAAGARIFSNPEPQSPASPSKRSSYFGTTNASPPVAGGPRRLIASRGTEIFTVVGNKIRWANLSKVKNEWEDRNHRQSVDDEPEVYRTLVTPVYYEILQLLISPSGTFLAVCTEHTVHIAVLPDSSRLAELDRSPLKLKTYQLGPTTHVIPESPLASVLWHPLAASSNSADCLVTVTAEAAVRLWEVDRANQWSFERPALAIDLRKLVDGVSSDQDYEPSGFGKNRGFSVDAFDMEVSAACFGGQGRADEDGWASMTLWTAMSNGDVYALCPLLPSKFIPASTTIPSLSVTAVSNISTLDTQSIDSDDRKAAEQQYEWVQEIDNEQTDNDDAAVGEVCYRPSVPSVIPRLQGPFEIDGFTGLGEGEVSDIHVIAARLDENSILSGEDDYEMVNSGLQYTLICMGTTAGQVYISIELEGVSGQWLPKKGRSTFSVPTANSRTLILLEKRDVLTSVIHSKSSWLMLTPNPSNSYSFYIKCDNTIQSVSLDHWASRVGIEASGEGDIDPGLATRLAVACHETICDVQEVMKADSSSPALPSSLLSAPASINSLDLGDSIISCVTNQAYMVSFEPHNLIQSTAPIGASNPPTDFRSSLALVKMLEDDVPDPVPTRAPYTPPEYLYKNQMQTFEELRRRIPATKRSVLSDKPLRLSPACLDTMTLAHRIFSQQSSHIETAAAELFRRCERLREELADQVKQMSELADRLQHVRSISASGAENGPNFEQRLNTARERQKQLLQRYEALRRKSGRVGTSRKPLSNKEQNWISEIQTLATTTGEEQDEHNANQTTLERYQAVHMIACELFDQSKQISRIPPSPNKDTTLAESPSLHASTTSISFRLQRERIAEVMQMVEREGAIIEAVTHRLNKLSTGISDGI